mmetsp:Transcript_57830/g.106875  ORF Transcript_57830/g.106875 Transcript_57830/m.106875 type:complete len:512 (-) Transcript_57830:104-1639(-)
MAAGDEDGCSVPSSALDPTQFGAKTIRTAGSLSMMLNNILGPGIANIPGLYQQAGWFFPTVFIVICAVSCFLTGEMLVIAMRAMPGNEHFQQRVEYSTLCGFYLPRRTAKFAVVVFLIAMLSANISNIIQTSQVFDQTIDLAFGDSCALEFFPRLRVFCSTDGEDVTPFGTGKVVLSLGAIIVAVCSIPLGYWNLEDNMIVQNVAMIMVAVAMLIWFIIFFALGLETDRVPFARLEDGLGSFHGGVGVILFNFMFISTLPSWICEKHPSVKSMDIVGWSLFLSVLSFLAVGVIAGWAFPLFYDGDNTLLSEMHHINNKTLRVLAGLSVDVYAIAANLASIPIFSIMLRYNLVEQHLLGPRAAGFVSVVMPWLLSVLLYAGAGFREVVELAGAFTSSLVNLIIPSLLFLASQKRCPQGRQVLLTELASTSAGSGATAESHEVDRSVASSESPACAVPGESPACAVPHDWSGTLRSADAAQRWRAAAWVNIALMCMVSVIGMMDQIAGGGDDR